MSHTNTVDILLEKSRDFLVPLRMGKGFSEENFDAFCLAIKEFGREWGGKEVIPKSAANLFIDAYTAMVGCSHLYPSQIAYIEQRADFMNDLIRNCCV